ncbi:DUF3626 domain-containing protein [Patescibacteria group bacterium]|nr:DUF3626 domain-containing protein [Patescibacteria group bacterium]
MAEEQPQASCPFCGFPVETKEHSPDCPNAGNVESGGEQLEGKGDGNVSAERVEQTGELETYLEKDLYPALGITQEDEEKFLKEQDYSDKHEALERVDKISFQNIRDSIRLFFQYYVKDGVLDMKSYRQKEEDVRKRVLADKGYNEDDTMPWQVGREIDDQVRAEVGMPEKIHFDKDQIFQKIQKQLTEIRDLSEITYNVKGGDSIERRLNTGKIIPMTEFPEDERTDMRKIADPGRIAMDFFGGNEAEYDDRRNQAEQAMGMLKSGEARPVYATLAGGSRQNIEIGGAPQYGDNVFVFNEEVGNRTVYTEGDSMNPTGLIDALRKKEKMSDKNGLGNRLLNREHAELSLALYYLSQDLDRPYTPTEQFNREGKKVQYIEAQILGGVDLKKDVGEIIINDVDVDPDGALEYYKQEYPQYAHLFRLAREIDEEV